MTGVAFDRRAATHPFYTLHADFIQTWHQDASETLEDLCSNQAMCENSNIHDNYQVDDLDP